MAIWTEINCIICMIITAGLSEAHVICVKQLIIVYNPYMHGIAWAFIFEWTDAFWGNL